MHLLVGERLKKEYKLISVFLGIILVGIAALVQNVWIIFGAWSEDGFVYSPFVYIQAFFILWYRWIPSSFLILCGITWFVAIYKKGDIKKAIDEFVKEQGGK